ncbi:2'-5' RNA ligase family protein [Nocardia jejuensis]|uniref:2'-5' RNA ligase family protein n=1 Tax=Nocardia jejuensis TaxID=328049 RepID=UPI00082C79BE|nr:2'-5' RNA ligase family protein [Nocardia jejuensis]
MGDSTGGRFEDVQWLRNHWSRATSRRGYYWFLTFEDAPELHSLAKHCQEAIDFSYYDPVSSEGLHMTLDRIAYEGDLDVDQVNAIEIAAKQSCEAIEPFALTIGELGGTQGAVGFDAGPAEQIRHLRNAVRSATRTAHPDAPVKPGELYPHVTIAYANSDGVHAGDVAASVAGLNAEIQTVEVSVQQVALVLLERRRCSYSWQVLSRIPLPHIDRAIRNPAPVVSDEATLDEERRQS